MDGPEEVVAGSEEEVTGPEEVVSGAEEGGCLAGSKVKVKFICIAHFMYKTIQSALHKIKAFQRGVEEALKICKRIYIERNKIIKMNKNKQQSR